MSRPLRSTRIVQDLLTAPAQELRMPDRLCRACAVDLRLDGAALLLVSAGNHFTHLIGATPGVATAMEDLQFELGEGPSVVVLQQDRPVLCPDLAPWRWAWPMFVPRAVDAGIAAMFAFPITLASSTVGVLTCYRNTPGTLSPTVIADAEVYAEAAAAMLMHLLASSRADQEELHPDLTGAPGRGDIHVAIGMVS